MTKKIASFTALTFALSTCFNTFAKESDEWKSLFNGKNLNGWTVKIHRHEAGVNFGNTFRAEDDMIKVRYDQYQNFNEQFGHLYYDTPFSNFHLSLEYRFSGKMMHDAPHFVELNSGVMFYSQSPMSMPKEQNWPISVEIQFLAELEPGKPRPTGNMCSPGTNIVYQGKLFEDHCLRSSSPTLKKDQWVHAELIVNNGEVTHKINGETVLEYSNPTIGNIIPVTNHDPKVFVEGKKLTTGHIALQAEGQPLEFRNIKIKEL